jgi:hypothetical protein
MTPRILSIDFGVANTGVALFPEREAFKITTKSNQPLGERISTIVDSIEATYFIHDSELVLIEKPYISRRARKHMDITFITFGAIYGMLLRIGADIVQIPPREWMSGVDTHIDTTRYEWAAGLGYVGINATKDDHTLDAVCLLEYYRSLRA